MKKVVNILPELILLLFLITTVSLVSVEQENLTCKKIKVEIVQNTEYKFIEKNDIIRSVQAEYPDIKAMKMDSINTLDLETDILRHPSVRDCDVFSDVNGVLYVQVEQRVPIVRVVNTMGESYYIDEDGVVIPVSEKYNARLLIANGNIKTPFLKYKNVSQIDSLTDEQKILNSIYRFALEIEKSSFWKNMLEQVYITAENDAILTPKVGPKEIEFGQLKEINYKMDKLYTFYKKGYPLKGYDYYKKLNVKHSNQVIATRVN